MLPHLHGKPALAAASLAAALFVGSGVAGPSPQEVPEQQYADPVLGFRFLHPATWRLRTVTDIGPQHVVEVLSPDGERWMAVHAGRTVDGAFGPRRIRSRIQERFPGARLRAAERPVEVAGHPSTRTRVDADGSFGEASVDFYSVDVGGRSFVIEFGALRSRDEGGEAFQRQVLGRFEIGPQGRLPRPEDPFLGFWRLVSVPTLSEPIPVPEGWTVRVGEPEESGLLVELDDPAGRLVWEIYRPESVSPFEKPHELLDRLVATLGANGFVISGTGVRRVGAERLPYAEGYYHFRDVPCRVSIYAFRRDGRLLLGYLSQVLPVPRALRELDGRFAAPFLGASAAAPSPARRLELARQALLEDRPEEALEQALERLRVLPNDPAGTSAAIEALAALGRWDEALARARALEDVGDRAEDPSARDWTVGLARAWQARIAADRGRHAEAGARAREAMSLSPDAARVLEEGAAALRRRGRHGAAHALLAGALEERPEDPVLLRAMAHVMATAVEPALHDPERAVELARRAVALDPGAGRGWLALSAALHAAGRLREAIEAQEIGVRAKDLPPSEAMGARDLLQRLRRLAGTPE